MIEKFSGKEITVLDLVLALNLEDYDLIYSLSH